MIPAPQWAWLAAVPLTFFAGALAARRFVIPPARRAWLTVVSLRFFAGALAAGRFVIPPARRVWLTVVSLTFFAGALAAGRFVIPPTRWAWLTAVPLTFFAGALAAGRFVIPAPQWVWLAVVSLTFFAGAQAEEQDLVSLSFQEIPVRSAFQLLAEASGQQLMVSDSVTGTVTLELTDVSRQDALALLLEMQGLDARRRHGAWVVATPAEFIARDAARLEAERAKETLAPLHWRGLRVNYASAAEVAALINEGQSSLLSERGSVQVDERTNTLIAHDTEPRLQKLEELLAELDLPARQVLIESRVVVANRNYSRNLGLRWGLTAASRGSNGKAAVLSGSGAATEAIVQALQAEDGPPRTTSAKRADRYSVNLPTAPAAGRFALALLHPDYLLDLELAAMQAEGQGRLISAPRVLASDQREASIQQGVEIPYQEAASSGATTTHFKQAALGLIVTPRITPNDHIILRLLVTKDSVGKIVATERGGAVPSIDTRRIETEVLVQDGQTLVLGGIRETESSDTVSSVPYLGSIPVLGRLFRSSIKTSNQTELLIFVTPTILKSEP